jgi:CBS domain-containing protein
MLQSRTSHSICLSVTAGSKPVKKLEIREDKMNTRLKHDLMDNAGWRQTGIRKIGDYIMKVKDLLNAKGKDIVSIDSNSSVEDAIKLMGSKKISALIVTDNARTVGIFTERDVVKCYLGSEGRSFSEIHIKAGMTAELIVAQLEDDLNSIMAVMVEKNIRHLPVVDCAIVVGMLSIRDVIQTQVSKLASEIHYLKDYITGSYT